MSPIPTWEQAVAAHEQYSKLSPEQKRICDTTGIIHVADESNGRIKRNRLDNDKKLALACAEELRNQTKREGMLSYGGLFNGQWYKDDITLSFNLMRVKNNCCLIPKSGLLKCIQRWLKLYPQFQLFTLSEIKRYPTYAWCPFKCEPKAKFLVKMNDGLGNLNSLKLLIDKTMVLGPDEADASKMKICIPIAWPPESVRFKFDANLAQPLTDPQFLGQVKKKLDVSKAED
ncbi:hypothetical protein L0F63_003461 [Massospora cicadina]|nr:hypothetical protein L0F63_003461 [Massospora cicadina]